MNRSGLTILRSCEVRSGFRRKQVKQNLRAQHSNGHNTEISKAKKKTNCV